MLLTTNDKKLRTFSAGDVSLFCAQMALILKSAIPLQDGVAAVREDIEDPRAKKIITMIETAVGQNVPFYQALEEAGVFPGYMVHMVEIGEKAGKLDDVLEALSQHYEREDKLKKNIRSAVVYPLVLVLMMSVVIAVLVVKVLPVFSRVFNDLGSEMSGFAIGVMNVGVAIGKYAFIVVIAAAVLLALFYLLAKTPGGAASFGKISARFSGTRRLSAKVASARFASVMSMLLTSGYSTDDALELVPKIISNDIVARKIEKCKDLIHGGTSFSEALTQVNMFPGVYGRMVGIGSKTGSLDSVMKKLADLYEEEVDASIDNAVAVIEPALVGVLSVIIGAILLSVMLPLMSIMSSIG